MGTVLKFLCKAIITIIALVLILVLLAWGGMNIAKFAIYSDYYAKESEICTNPGLNDGFVCQGICVSEDYGKILVSGYMDDDSNSRIYVTDIDTDRSYYIQLKRNGKTFTGHSGGVATSGDTVYLASGSKLYILSLYDILTAKNGDVFDIGSGVPVNNAASYVYCDEEYIYVGDFFHTSKTYFKEYTLDDGKTKVNALISRYRHSDFIGYTGENAPAPDRIYSVIPKVQGVCFTPDGKIVFSTSLSIAHSVFYVYNEADTTDSGNTLDGVPVYVLGNCTDEFIGPAMSEDLDYYDGKVITLFESASNKYIYGKFFFANEIIGLEIK